MEDTLISFETAILAKEKGFNKKVLFSYENSYKKSFLYCGGVLYNSSKNKYGYTENLEYNLYNHNSQKKLKVYSAPSQSLLQKWLREKHSIDIVIYPVEMKTETGYLVQEIKDKEYSYYILIGGIRQYFVYECHSNYEEALEQGLLEGLKLIK